MFMQVVFFISQGMVGMGKSTSPEIWGQSFFIVGVTSTLAGNYNGIYIRSLKALS